jgi:hypothetical protein
MSTVDHQRLQARSEIVEAQTRESSPSLATAHLEMAPSALYGAYERVRGPMYYVLGCALNNRERLYAHESHLLFDRSSGEPLDCLILP